MSMTRQHFEMLANCIKRNVIAIQDDVRSQEDKDIAIAALEAFAYDLSDDLMRFNRAFNGQRFINACGVGDE